MKKSALVIALCSCVIVSCIIGALTKSQYKDEHIYVSRTPILVAPKVPKTKQIECSAWSEMVSTVKYYEGFYSAPYHCPAGFKTIGYGFTEKRFVSRTNICEKESSNILESKLRSVEKDVERIVVVPLTSYQKCALVSFTYNCEVDNLIKLVSGPGRLNDGNYDSVTKILPLYNKGGGKTLKGLTKRRAEEVRLWNKG